MLTTGGVGDTVRQQQLLLNQAVLLPRLNRRKGHAGRLRHRLGCVTVATFGTLCAVCCLLVALNTNLTQLWAFYDQKVAFAAWAGVLSQFDMLLQHWSLAGRVGKDRVFC